MMCSPSQKIFPGPINVHLTAIKPDVRGVKQLDDGIDFTSESSVGEEVFFALIDFQGCRDGERRRPKAWRHCNRYESMGNTMVQLRGPLSSGSMVIAMRRRVVCALLATRELRTAGAIVGTKQPVSETNKCGGKSHVNCERTCKIRTDECNC
jgi:hypothetical protein